VIKYLLVVGLILFLALSLGTNHFLRWLYPIGYKEQIQEYAEEYGVDPYLVAAVVKIESNFRPQAISPKGARGLMQLMPETAQWIGEQINEPIHPDALFNPQVNIKLGTWYLANLLEEFDGEKAQVLAAYNGGRGNVRQWLDNKVWSGRLEDIHQIPFRETRGFIRRVSTMETRYQMIYRGVWPEAVGEKGDTHFGTD
jgi:soluble lytic murein transglycosylase